MINFKSKQLRQWQNFNEEELHSWLLTCREYSESINWNIEPKKEITLDGRFIYSTQSFLCEFSEQLLGVGGYFGSNLDAFDDCFIDFYSIKEPIQVSWHHFQDSLTKFKDNLLISQILEILTLKTQLSLFTTIPFEKQHFVLLKSQLKEGTLDKDYLRDIKKYNPALYTKLMNQSSDKS